ncbi:AAA family ATPase [Lysinibacillus capsici]|uniref:ATP-dependent nuclease n=1 Tax=Lysinibacillus capsici TaxID=2115968 RepID=UPI0032DF68B1
MHISNLNISGYKNTKGASKIEFNKGLNILVGENGAGKTTIINALRHILRENEFSYLNINEDDFYVSLDKKYSAPKIKIDLTFESLNSNEQVTFLTWCDEDFNAQLHLEVNSNPNRKGYYKKEIWGGVSKSSIFEEETFECIDCIYLPPLRDAEEKLINGRKSRLAQLLKKQYGDNKETLVQNVSNFNKQITNNVDGNYNEIEFAKNNINKKLKDTLGKRLGQSVNLQFAETTFNRIVESIRMVFFPGIQQNDPDMFRDISVNSLGYNNLLYIATVFAELELLKDNNVMTVLLIEEPEAHLHPQLQVKFIKYLEELTKNLENMQVFITTHSPVLASSVDLDKLIHIVNQNESIIATALKNINLGRSKNYINRWLDITKSTLLFSKGIILVEGISEAMLVPAFAKIVLAQYNESALKHAKEVLPNSLEEAGVSVININGINFTHFMKLFSNCDESEGDKKLPVFCAGITDNDPPKEKIEVKDDNGEIVYQGGQPLTKLQEVYPTFTQLVKGANSALELKEQVNSSKWGRLYSSPLKTFEYDLLMEGNISIMAQVLQTTWPKNSGSVFITCDSIIASSDNYSNEIDKVEHAKYVFNHIESKEVGKGMYAQELTNHIESKIDEIKKLELEQSTELERIQTVFKVPKYIKEAIIWSCGG